MVKKYRVGLTGEEQEELRALVSKGRAAAYKQTHARILLLSDSLAFLLKVRQGNAALGRREQLPPSEEACEAHLIAMAMSAAVEGRVGPSTRKARASRRLCGRPEVYHR